VAVCERGDWANIVAAETEELPQGAWRQTLEEITRAHSREVVRIEVLSGQLGDQIQVDGLPLAYVEYDDKDDVVVVAVHERDRDDIALRHIVEHPLNVRVHPRQPAATVALDVAAKDGTRTFVMLQPRP
jgi:hypothetical protein